MAAIFTPVPGAGGEFGTTRHRWFDVTFNAAYATGGVPVALQDVGLTNLFGIRFLGHRLVAGTARTTSWIPEYDPATGKIQFFGTNGAAGSALAEMPNATALSTEQLRVCIEGS